MSIATTQRFSSIYYKAVLLSATITATSSMLNPDAAMVEGIFGWRGEGKGPERKADPANRQDAARCMFIREADRPRRGRSRAYAHIHPRQPTGVDRHGCGDRA